MLGVAAQEATEWFNSANTLFFCNMDLKEMLDHYEHMQRHVTGQITQPESNRG